jgi:hypothetical protein
MFLEVLMEGKACLRVAGAYAVCRRLGSLVEQMRDKELVK